MLVRAMMRMKRGLRIMGVAALGLPFLTGAAHAQLLDTTTLPGGTQARPSSEASLPGDTRSQPGVVAPPTITIVEPANGSLIPTRTPRITVAFTGAGPGFDIRDFQISINGVDLTSAFTVTPSGASYQVPPGTVGPGEDRRPREVIQEGQNVIVARLRSNTGLAAMAASGFIVDTRSAPVPRSVSKSPIEAVFLSPPPLPPILSRGVPPPEVPSLSRDLVQFGYDQFTAPVSTFAPVGDVPVGPDYVLGPGDQLFIYLGGLHENAFTVPVNSRGEIVLPRAGVLPVWGLSVSQVERLAQQRLAETMKGVEVRVAMGPLRTIQVSVVGEVVRPGRYTLSSLATVSNALHVAGGPTKLGTLRAIKLLRNSQEIGSVDLYELLIGGRQYRDYQLQSGDVIYVSPIGPTVGIIGQIKRPAIYEFDGPTRVGGLIQMAGGPLSTARLQRIQVERAEAYERKVVLDLDVSRLGQDGRPAGDIELRDGDLVKVFPIDLRIYNTVTLGGFVTDPGEHQLKPNMRLGELLRPEMVLPEAYLERVEIVRLREPDLEYEVLTVNLRQLWTGDESQNIELKRLDRITIVSDRRGPAIVTLSGEVKRPGQYALMKGERLSSVLARAGGFTENAFLNGAIFSRESVRRIQQEQLDRFVKAQEERLLTEAATTVVSGIDKEEVAVQQQTVAQRRELLRTLASRVALGRVVVSLLEPRELERSPDDIILEDRDSLFIPGPPSSVVVLGSVRNPTSVLYKADQDLDYYLNRAGGATPEADNKALYILKADGSAISSFVKVRRVDAGDTIIMPPKVEVKVRPLSITRDLITIFAQTALTIAALATLF